MGIARETLSRDRIQFAESLSKRDIERIVSDREIRVVQTSTPVNRKNWKIINDLLLAKRPDIGIRVFGHYSDNCDLSHLEVLQNVRQLSVDCLMKASNIEAIENLEKLESLSVGIYSLENFDFLDKVPATLNELFLGATKSKKPNLSNLVRFSQLKRLYIEGQNKDIGTIGEIASLEKLVLRSVSPKDISFIRKLKDLWSLDIKLGGIKDLNPLGGLANIKYLELWQIMGLSDISVISTMTGLQYLFLQSLRNVATLPDMTGLKHLRRVYLETMKGLKEVSSLEKAPALEEFVHVCAQNMTPQQYSNLIKSQTLKKVLIGFGSDKKNNEMLRMMENRGIDKYCHELFVFN